MGYFLLWIENLSLSLLVTATLLACIGRLHNAKLRLGLRAAIILVFTLVYLGLVCPAAALELQPAPIKLGLFYPFLALMVCYLVGALWLGRSAMQRTDDDPPSVASADWPRGKLAIAL